MEVKRTEIRNRILVAVYAYAYEFEHDSLVTDSEFDQLALKINPKVKTGNRIMDKFFMNHYDPCTGMWIHKHPQLDGIKWLYKYVFRRENHRK